MTSETTEVETPKKSIFTISETTYDLLKSFAMVFLPAVSTLYFSLGALWDFPAVEQVIGTIAILATFIGIFLNKSTNVYNKSDAKYDGDIVITEGASGQKTYLLELNGHPSTLNDKNEVSFRIKSSA